LTEASFEIEVLEAPTPVLVDFWAPWCGPCRRFAPTIDALAAEYNGRAKVAKLNTDEAQGIARRYEIRTIPSIIVFNRGKLVQKFVGTTPKTQLAAALDGALAAGAPTQAMG
jgi:thioredoxin 1